LSGAPLSERAGAVGLHLALGDFADEARTNRSTSSKEQIVAAAR
jgi:hypothetical protein